MPLQMLRTAQKTSEQDGSIHRDFFRWLSGILSALNGVTSQLLTGTGDPEGEIIAPVGTVYLRSDGGAITTLYVKESGTGNTGWVGK